MLDYDLSLCVLQKIIGKYDHIDAVPQGYHQAELYLIEEEEEEKQSNQNELS